MRLIVLIVISTMMIGCATIVASSTRGIELESEPVGATVTVNGQVVGVTPVKIELDNHKQSLVTFQKPGYYPVSCTLDASVGARYVILDIVLGLIPVIVDAVTGDWRTLDDDECSVVLNRAPGTY